MMRLWGNSVFRTFVVSVVLITGFLIVGGVQGFGLFELRTVNQNIKLGSTYVRQSSVDDAAMGTVLAQLGLGNNDYTADPTFENLFRILDVSQGIARVDILNLVTNADDRQQVFRSHVNAIQAVRFETIDVAAGYQAMANRFFDKSTTCLIRKEAGDAEFYQGVNQANELLATRGYEQSLEAAPCYITNRIKANAMAYLGNRVQAYAAILSERERILISNQEMILRYPELLQSDLPGRLLETQRQLSRLQSVPYTQVQSNFAGFTTSQVGFLPNYFEVFFPGKRPTFFDPQITLTPDGRN